MDLQSLYHRHVPRALHAHIKGYRGSARHDVESAMTVRGLPRRSTVRGSVWAVAGVRNEQDVIGETLRHLLDQDVAGIIVADNGSTDGTPDVLADFARDGAVHLVEDREPRFLQPEKMTYLSHLAWSAGAEWIIPFDADEHWYAPGQSLAAHLAGSTDSVLHAVMHDVVPLGDELSFGEDEEVLVRRLDAADASSIERKVAFRAGPTVYVRPGNHEVLRDGTRAEGLHLLHYQWRSREHRVRKARRGAAAHARTGDHDRGWHWFALDALDDAALAESWDHIRRDAEDSPEWVRASAPWRSWDRWDPAGVM
ncbi:glycosyltransferase family 2 protein [Microbacterium thalassium]|uniref:Glycosyltransferase family 2 protein n=1 Tax=Microbacterium thalassium TaxID=362649 RepID=A0A7X0FRQ2_9MICO|nr:glycosyltransferase family 2 protein [Microbacterium thalassium]MBB6392421.1 hypothetical protein [Microbacterium thalassium]GLK25046.1 hypothetical protein GCM10017607_23640 [Microbacterium thalassium]